LPARTLTACWSSKLLAYGEGCERLFDTVGYVKTCNP
jgi:hypothetical protein